jgi:hypothetical protein
MLGPAEGKSHVAAATLTEAIEWRSDPGDALLHGCCKAFEALASDLGEQLILAGEVAIGRVVGDAGAPRHLTERECAGADLAYEGNGGIEQSVAKIYVVVRLRSSHALFLTEGC